MKKVVYLCMFPLTAPIERFLFIRNLLEAGFNVEYWDLSDIYYKGFSFQDIVTRECVRRIQSLAELRQRIKKEDIKSTVFIAQTTFNGQSLPLFYILTRLKCRVGYFPLAVLPLKGVVQKVFEKFRRAMTDGVPRQGFLNLFAKACRKAGLVKHYDFVFAPGRLTRESYCKHSRVIGINYVDYDRFILSQRSTARLVQGRYCVFLDEGAIANEDHQILNNKTLNAAAYYGALNRFFDYIEKRFSVKLVIAAHPGVHYGKDIFPGRVVFEGKTCELVKDCDFVISQSSFSVSFAVLYGKPIVFIYTGEFVEKRPTNWQVMGSFAGILRREAVDISTTDIDSLKELSPVDPAAYDDFKYTFLTSKESEAKASKDIVVENLMAMAKG